MFVLFLISVIALFSNSPFNAKYEQNENIINLLSWCPDGEYPCIFYFNYDKYKSILANDPKIDIYIEEGNQLFKSIINSLFEEMKLYILAYVILEYNDDVEFEFDMIKHQNRNEELKSKKILVSAGTVGSRDKRYYFNMKRSTYAVISCDPQMEDIIKSMLENKFLAIYFKYNKNHNIMTLNTKERQKIFLYYDKPSMILLASYDVKLLKRMIDTGYMRDICILENRNYLDLNFIELRDNSIVYWYYTSMIAALRDILENKIENDRLLEQYIKTRINAEEVLYHIWTLSIDDEIRRNQYIRYSSSEVAEENKDWFRESRQSVGYSEDYPQVSIDYNNAEVEAWKWEIDGDLQIGTLIYDKKLTEMRERSYYAMSEMMKNRENKKKEK